MTFIKKFALWILREEIKQQTSLVKEMIEAGMESCELLTKVNEYGKVLQAKITVLEGTISNLQQDKETLIKNLSATWRETK